MSLRTCCRNFSLICVLLALVVLAAPAFAGNTCLQDEYNNVSKQKLNCTANDVRVAEAVNTRALDGSALTTCFEGSTFNFIADRRHGFRRHRIEAMALDALIADAWSDLKLRLGDRLATPRKLDL